MVEISSWTHNFICNFWHMAFAIFTLYNTAALGQLFLFEPGAYCKGLMGRWKFYLLATLIENTPSHLPILSCRLSLLQVGVCMHKIQSRCRLACFTTHILPPILSIDTTICFWLSVVNVLLIKQSLALYHRWLFGWEGYSFTITLVISS
jgi:hypothetical protein